VKLGGPALILGGGERRREKLRESFSIRKFYFLQVKFPAPNPCRNYDKNSVWDLSFQFHSQDSIEVTTPRPGSPVKVSKKKFKKNRIPLNFCQGKTLFLEIRT
jgi:hypothetical protein